MPNFLKSNQQMLQISICIMSFFVGIVFAPTDMYEVSLIFVSVGALFLFLGYLVFGINYIRELLKPRTVSVKRPRNSILGMIYGLVMRYNFFKKLDNYSRNVVLSGSGKSGILLNPVKVARQIIIAFVCSIPIFVVSSVVCAVLFNQPLFALLSLSPFAILLYPQISNMLQSSESTSGYDKDLAYFLSYLHISHLGVQMSIYSSMIRLIGTGIFPAIENNAVMLKRWVKFNGMTEISAINKLANSHANKTFQSFLFAYFDISKSNPPGLDDYISKTASAEFEKSIISDEKGIGKISTIFVFGGMALIMVPALLVMMSFAVPESDIIGMVANVILVTPIIFTVLAILMYRKKSDYSVKVYPQSLVGMVLFVPFFIITPDVLLAISAGFTVTCMINGIFVSRQMGIISSTVNGFVPFVRDLIERRKVDSNFVTSLKKIFEYDMQKKYGHFSTVLYNVKRDMTFFSDKKHDVFFNGNVTSERLKMMLFVLQSVFDGGHKSTVSSLERLHYFSERAVLIKNKTEDTLKMSSLLLLMAPLIFFIVLSAISTLMSSFTSNIPEIPAGINIDASTSKYFEKFDTSVILSAMKPAIFVMSVCSGITMSKVAYQSFSATLPLGICMGICTVIFVGWDYFFEVISNLVDL